jgi:hypothetical protein
MSIIICRVGESNDIQVKSGFIDFKIKQIKIGQVRLQQVSPW